MQVEISVDRAGDLAVVRTVGEIDLHTAPELQDALSAAIEDGARRIIVDLSAIDFMDSTGLSVIVRTVTEAEEVGGTVKVVAVADKITKLFSLTGLDQHVEMFETLDGARAAS